MEESIIKTTGLPEALVNHALAPLTAKSGILVHKEKGEYRPKHSLYFLISFYRSPTYAHLCLLPALISTSSSPFLRSPLPLLSHCSPLAPFCLRLPFPVPTFASFFPHSPSLSFTVYLRYLFPIVFILSFPCAPLCPSSPLLPFAFPALLFHSL